MKEIVVSCDRCRLRGVQVVTVLGKDLCAACQAEFVEWVDFGDARAGELQPVDRAGHGERFRQVEAVCRMDGHVTSMSLAKVTGQHRTQCNWYLHAVKRLGHLEFHGRGVFTLPKSKAAVG